MHKAVWFDASAITIVIGVNIVIGFNATASILNVAWGDRVHELGLSRSIAAIVGEHAGSRPVKRVLVSIGPKACVEQRALAFCWEIVTADSPLSQAKLEFTEGENDAFLIKEFEFREGE